MTAGARLTPAAVVLCFADAKPAAMADAIASGELPLGDDGALALGDVRRWLETRAARRIPPGEAPLIGTPKQRRARAAARASAAVRARRSA